MAGPFTFSAEVKRGGELEGEWTAEISPDRATAIDGDLSRAMASAREALLQAVTERTTPISSVSYALSDSLGNELQRVVVEAGPDSTSASVASTLEDFEPQIRDRMASRVLGVH